jgi:hypothetical protein
MNASDQTPEPFASSVYGFRVFSITEGTAPEPRPIFNPWMGAFMGRPTDTPATQVPDAELVNPNLPGGYLLAQNEYAAPGYLRGPLYKQWIWGPAVNQAHCLTYDRNRVNYLHNSGPAPTCHCGFWAYTFGDHVLQASGPSVLAAVQAGGKIILGSKGFRAHKARIVALCFPDPANDPDTARVDSRQALHLDKKKVKTLTVGDPETTLTRQKKVRRRLTERLLGRPATLPAARATVMPANGYDPMWETVAPDLREAVTARYPVPVFDSVAAMQAEFPPSDPTDFGIPAEDEPEEKAS